MNFMLINKMLKNVVLNYSYSLGLFSLNSDYKSLKGGAPGREEEHLSHSELKEHGDPQKGPKSTWSLSLPPSSSTVMSGGF